MVSGGTRLGTSTLWTLFGGHPLKLERYREDYHDPCARMTRRNREWYRTFCINGHLHYPNDIDRSLNETVTDKLENITLIIITIPPPVSPLYLLLLVRPRGYTVNLYSFYFDKLIGKLTVSLQFQEFN